MTRTSHRHRLALVGDVHANWNAFAAVLRDVRTVGCADGVLTGDLVLRGDAPRRCVDAARNLGWLAVVGNTDRKVVERPPRAPSHPASARVGSRSWTYRELSPGDRRWLAERPVLVRCALGRFSVVVVHGTPTDPALPLFAPESSDADLVAIATELQADVVVAAHTHRQMVRIVRDRLFVNPGSVGETLDPADRRPRWAWLEVSAGRPVAHLVQTDAPLATVRRPFRPGARGTAAGSLRRNAAP